MESAKQYDVPLGEYCEGQIDPTLTNAYFALCVGLQSDSLFD